MGFGDAMDAVAALVKEFEPQEVITDQFAAAAIVDELRRRGGRCTAVPWTAQNKAEAVSLLKASLTVLRQQLSESA